MIKGEIISKLDPILSNGEIKVVLKRLNNEHITQTESNYLSRSVRPKLKAAEFASSNKLLSLLNYRRRKYEREDKTLNENVLNAVKGIIKDVKAIVIFGSYIMNNHANYRDIDVMIILKRKLWKNSAKRYKLKKDFESEIRIKTDITLVTYKDLKDNFPYSQLLQTELEFSKVIFGNLNLNKKRIINKTYLYQSLLEIENITELGKSIESEYIYNAIRTCLAIRLFLKNRVSNRLIIDKIENDIGKITAKSLKDNKANKIQREIALNYLKYLYNKIEGNFGIKC